MSQDNKLTNKINLSICTFLKRSIFENYKKNPKAVQKTKLMLKKAKIILFPYILSCFFIKMVLFDGDLFSPCFCTESP